MSAFTRPAGPGISLPHRGLTAFVLNAPGAKRECRRVSGCLAGRTRLFVAGFAATERVDVYAHGPAAESAVDSEVGRFGIMYYDWCLLFRFSQAVYGR